MLFDYDPETKAPPWAGAGLYGIIKDATGLEVSLASRRSRDRKFVERIARDLVPIFEVSAPPLIDRLRDMQSANRARARHHVRDIWTERTVEAYRTSVHACSDVPSSR